MSDRMNPEVKALWLAALRSGDYIQVKGVLKGMRHRFDSNDDQCGQYIGHCCLGVLSELAPAECGAFKQIGDAWYFLHGGEENETAVLSDSVRDWSGVKSSTGGVLIGTYKNRDGVKRDLHDHLTALNDDYNMTFEQIADVVEYAL